jgi:hypothetical protein
MSTVSADGRRDYDGLSLLAGTRGDCAAGAVAPMRGNASRHCSQLVQFVEVIRAYAVDQRTGSGRCRQDGVCDLP